ASAVLASTAPAHEVTLRTLRQGVPESITLAKGAALRIHSRPTAYPLVLSEDARLDADSLPMALRPGAYLSVAAGGRQPFRIGAGHCTRITASTPVASPPGFCFIPRGTFSYGGDQSAIGAVPREEREVGDFLICEHEVTFGEWFEFLNDAQIKPR